jgi:hypothetical protein
MHQIPITMLTRLYIRVGTYMSHSWTSLILERVIDIALPSQESERSRVRLLEYKCKHVGCVYDIPMIFELVSRCDIFLFNIVLPEYEPMIIAIPYNYIHEPMMILIPYNYIHETMVIFIPYTYTHEPGPSQSWSHGSSSLTLRVRTRSGEAHSILGGFLRFPPPIQLTATI